MNVKTKEMYSEVYSILNMLGNDYISKLPRSLITMINEERLKTYEPKYELDISLDKQKLQRDTMAMIALFHLNYWCDLNEEKENLKELFKDNEKKYQAQIREKYNPDNIFKKKENNKYVESDNEKDMYMIQYKETFFKRIMKKIMNIFHKN